MGGFLRGWMVRSSLPTDARSVKSLHHFRGLMSTLQAATQTWQGEMALRFLMGVFEAGYGPGIPYLLSFFYLRHELGSRIGFFLAAAPLANTFAGALAYGITSGHSKLANWRLLFLVEGLPTLIMAPVAFFFLPDAPEKSRFLNEDEKRIAKARGVRQAGHEKRSGGVVWKDIAGTLLDPKAWFTAVWPPSNSLAYRQC
jgi:MFS family permease